MGKLFFSRLTLVACLFLIFGIRAQEMEKYCVFQVEGQPELIDAEAKTTLLEKGMFIYPDYSLTLGEGDKVLLTDQLGAMYEIKKKVTLPYARISFYTKKDKQSTFTLTYLKYIWKKLWEKEEKENIGVVFRAPNGTAPLAPLDSVQVFGAEVTFVWKGQKKDAMQYFYLESVKDRSLMRMATNGDSLILPVGGNLLHPGQSYRWAVTSEADLDSETLQFNSFGVLTQNAFDRRLKDLENVRLEFMALGLSEEAIKRTFCEDQKLCFN